MIKVKVFIDIETLERLRRLGSVGEETDTRIINYIEFHPEYWSRKI